MSHWKEQTEQLLSGLETCDPIYRPTNFWAPGVRQLSAALQAQGLESFKSWPGGVNLVLPRLWQRLLQRHHQDDV